MCTENPLLVARFWSKVDVRRATECWEWQGAHKDRGYEYGVINGGPERGSIRANRLAYELVNGPLAEDIVVRHTCDNPRCCNPAHLVAGTQADNVADMHERGRRKYSSRLTKENREHIIALRRSGWRVANIAKRFGISAAYVSKITTGKR